MAGPGITVQIDATGEAKTKAELDRVNASLAATGRAGAVASRGMTDAGRAGAVASRGMTDANRALARMELEARAENAALARSTAGMGLAHGAVNKLGTGMRGLLSGPGGLQSLSTGLMSVAPVAGAAAMGLYKLSEHSTALSSAFARVGDSVDGVTTKLGRFIDACAAADDSAGGLGSELISFNPIATGFSVGWDTASKSLEWAAIKTGLVEDATVSLNAALLENIEHLKERDKAEVQFDKDSKERAMNIRTAKIMAETRKGRVSSALAAGLTGSGTGGAQIPMDLTDYTPYEDMPRGTKRAPAELSSSRVAAAMFSAGADRGMAGMLPTPDQFDLVALAIGRLDGAMQGFSSTMEYGASVMADSWAPAWTQVEQSFTAATIGKIGGAFKGLNDYAVDAQRNQMLSAETGRQVLGLAAGTASKATALFVDNRRTAAGVEAGIQFGLGWAALFDPMMGGPLGAAAHWTSAALLGAEAAGVGSGGGGGGGGGGSGGSSFRGGSAVAPAPAPSSDRAIEGQTVVMKVGEREFARVALDAINGLASMHSGASLDASVVRRGRQGT